MWCCLFSFCFMTGTEKWSQANHSQRSRFWIYSPSIKNRKVCLYIGKTNAIKFPRRRIFCQLFEMQNQNPATKRHLEKYIESNHYVANINSEKFLYWLLVIQIQAQRESLRVNAIIPISKICVHLVHSHFCPT